MISRPKHILNHNPTPMKAQFLPLFNVNLSQLQLNSISTKLPLNLISTSFQPQVQINLSLNSTATITSTQYGCDIKATQSCSLSNNIYITFRSKLNEVTQCCTIFLVLLKSNITNFTPAN